MLSLHARVLLAATVIVAAFLGATGWALDRAFRDATDAAMRDRLRAQIYGLLAAGDLDRTGALQLPASLPEPRFNLPRSGLYADVVAYPDKLIWRSTSGVGMTLPATPPAAVGEMNFSPLSFADGTAVLALSFGVEYESARGRATHFTFRAMETVVAAQAEILRFRRSLWGWLGAAALLLLAAQGAILHWGLAPLRRVADELKQIDAGERELLTGNYPRELRRLTDNLNAMLAAARRHLERYRDALGNLAHNLKTPLAVLKNTAARETATDELRRVLRQELDRMNEMVEYQLQRAATAGRRALAAPVPVRDCVEKLLDALRKAYHDKPMACEIIVDSGAVFHGDRGDLLEVLGNLLDNAFKWGRKRMRIRATNRGVEPGQPPRVEIVVEDDGPGISNDARDRVIARGARGDEATPGHGLGLAMVQATVAIYGGELELGASPLGGAKVTVRL